MDTRKHFYWFLEQASWLDVVGVAELAKLRYAVLNRWLLGWPNGYTEGVVLRFLEGDGARMLEITRLLKGERNCLKRLDLHRERAAIMKKARIHRTANQCVPSLTIND